MKLLVTLVAAWCLVEVVVGQTNNCRRWCTKGYPGDRDRPRYCCDDGSRPEIPYKEHLGHCPLRRPDCKGVASGGFPPNGCAHDGWCFPQDRCCWDACLDHHICKPAEFVLTPL